MNTIDICQKILSNLIVTFSEVMPIFLPVLAVIILLAGLASFFTQILKTQIFLKKLNKGAAIPPNVQLIIDHLHLKGKVDLIEDPRIFSFCFGIIKPRIALSTGLLRTVSNNELKAVLLHESQHLLRYDPLKMIVGQTISSMFFFVPIFKDIQNYYLFSREIAADRAVIKNGDKRSLISVLSKLMVAPSPKFAGVAALTNTNDLEKRILYLSGKKPKFTFRPSMANIFISILVAVSSLIIVNAPVYAVNIEEDSLDHTLFICPKEVNFSKNILYTPKDNNQ